jgi:hypothetical protein
MKILLAISLALSSTIAPAHETPARGDTELKEAQTVAREFVSRLRRTLTFEAASEGLLITTPAARQESHQKGEHGGFPQIDDGIEPGLLALGNFDLHFAAAIRSDPLCRLSFAQWHMLHLSLLGGLPDCDDPKVSRSADVCGWKRRYEQQKMGIRSEAEFDATLRTVEQLRGAMCRRLTTHLFQSPAYKKGL